MRVQTPASNHSFTSHSFADDLLRWYRSNTRVLPWRLAPDSPQKAETHHARSDRAHPYRVWMSEIMLQQTTVAAVADYFERFQKRWPSIEQLAAADEAQVMAAWAGLGYYARARNMLACARLIVRDFNSEFPNTEDELRNLPGVGDYTAAAIAAIAFGRPAVVIDANVERVIARYAAITTPFPAARRLVRRTLEPLVPAENAGDFAQAMMDLGALVCTARRALCDACPLAQKCLAQQKKITDQLPVKPTKKAKPLRFGTAYWIVRKGKVRLVRRPAKGMLGAMRALPDDDWHGSSDHSAAAAIVQHSFTHFNLRLSIIRQAAHDEHDQHGEHDQPPPGEWWPIDALNAAGLPTLYRKAVTKMRKDISDSWTKTE